MKEIPKYCLILETSTERGILAISTCSLDAGDEILHSIELPFGLLNSQHLLPEIEKCFKQFNMSVLDLKFIAVGIGPGSYTGIRVAATVGKTLSFTKKIPLIAVDTLSCFVPAFDCEYAAIIDAKVAGVYLQIGSKKGGVNHRQSYVLPIEDSLDYLKNVSVIITPNAKLIRPKIEALLGINESSKLEWIESAPIVNEMLNLANKSYTLGHFSTDGSLALNYMRKTQAEIERDSKIR